MIFKTLLAGVVALSAHATTPLVFPPLDIHKLHQKELARFQEHIPFPMIVLLIAFR